MGSPPKVSDLVYIYIGGYQIEDLVQANGKKMEILEKLQLKTLNVPRVMLEDVKGLERDIGARLPESYEALLIRYNGGIPTLNTFWLNSEEMIVNNFFFLENSKFFAADEYLLTEGIRWNYRRLNTVKPKNFFHLQVILTATFFVSMLPSE